MSAVIRCAALFLFLWSTNSMACSFDTDCQPGSRCAIKSGQIYGVCVGGISPGNSNDRQPVYSPTDVNRTYGNTCGFDTDCGPGSTCVKGSGSIYGTCMGQRQPATTRQKTPTPSYALPHQSPPRAGESYPQYLLRQQRELQQKKQGR